MGLDTSHGCWSGSYSAFMRWREMLARVAGLPPLALMEGYFTAGGSSDPFRTVAEQSPGYAATYYASLPIRWDALKPDPLYELLHHSDCDGEIPASSCGPIADSLERLLPLLPVGDGGGHIGDWRDKTQQFIDGLREAARLGEAVDFH